MARTIDEMADKFPAIKKTFASYNQVYLTNSVVLDTYQVFTKPAVKGLADMKGLKIAGAGFNLRYLGAGRRGRRVGAADAATTTRSRPASSKAACCGPKPRRPSRSPRSRRTCSSADIGAVNTKVLTVNADTWAKLPAEVKTVLQEVAIEYRDLLAKIAAEEGAASVAAYKKAGGTVHDLPKAERSKWAQRPAQPGQGMGRRAGQERRPGHARC